MGGLVGLNVMEARKSQERALLATARAVSMAVDMDLLRNMEAAEALTSSDAVAARDWARLRDRADRLKLDAHAWVAATDRSGARLLNTVEGLSPDSAPRPHGLPRPANIRRALSERRAVVSGLFVGAASGRPVVAIDAPALTGNDEVVVSVILDPVRFLDVIERQTLTGDAMVTLVDARRRVIARSRDHARHIGASATPAMIAAMDAAPEGVVPSRSLDGDRTVVAYTRSALSGWTAMVVVPRSTIEAGRPFSSGPSACHRAAAAVSAEGSASRTAVAAKVAGKERCWAKGACARATLPRRPARSAREAGRHGTVSGGRGRRAPPALRCPRTRRP